MYAENGLLVLSQDVVGLGVVGGVVRYPTMIRALCLSDVQLWWHRFANRGIMNLTPCRE
jgi:hypothetical protein